MKKNIYTLAAATFMTVTCWAGESSHPFGHRRIESCTSMQEILGKEALARTPRKKQREGFKKTLRLDQTDATLSTEPEVLAEKDIITRVQFCGYIWLLIGGDVRIINSNSNKSSSFEKDLNKDQKTDKTVTAYHNELATKKFKLSGENKPLFVRGLLVAALDHAINALPKTWKAIEKLRKQAESAGESEIANLCEQLPTLYQDDDRLHEFQALLHKGHMAPLAKIIKENNPDQKLLSGSPQRTKANGFKRPRQGSIHVGSSLDIFQEEADGENAQE